MLFKSSGKILCNIGRRFTRAVSNTLAKSCLEKKTFSLRFDDGSSWSMKYIQKDDVFITPYPEAKLLIFKQCTNCFLMGNRIKNPPPPEAENF
jgi:polygalacturonase